MNYPPSFNSRFILRSKIFSRAAAVFVMLISALVLAGWLFDIHRFKSVYGQITMKANTALALFLTGASLLALNLGHKNRFARRAGQLFAAIAAIIGALTLGEHLFGWNLGIDELVFTEPSGAQATTSPGRMGPPASTCFTLSGIALLLLHAGRAIPFAQAMSIITGLWALLAIIGYAYSADKLYSVAGYTGIALHTAISLFVSSLGLLAARIDSGITSVISSDRAGGQMARRLLIAAVVVPFLLGWLRLGAQWRGYYDLSDGTAYLILALIVIFTAIIWQSAAKLNYTEQQRLAAEDRFRLAVEASPDAKVMVDEEGRIILVNSQTERLFGYSREELIGQPVEMLVPDRFHSLHAKHRAGFARMPQARSMGAGRDLFGRRKDGSEVPIEIGLNPIKVKEQTLILSSIVDITERKRGEEERQYRSEQLKTLIDRAPLGVYLIDADFRIAQVNPVAMPVFGDIPGGALGRDFDEIIHILWDKNYADEVVRIFRHTLETGECYVAPERAEYRIDRQKIEYYEWRLDRITLPDGRYGLVCYFRDISQQVEARKKIEESRDALRESEHLQRLLAQIGELSERMPETDELIGAICERVGKDFGVSRCGYTVADLEAGTFIVTRDYCGNLRSLAGVYPSSKYSDQGAYANGLVVNEDLATNPRTAGKYEELWAPLNLRAVLSVPLYREGQLAATFWVSHHEPRSWTATEIEWIKLIADRVWLVVERKRGEEERARLLRSEQGARAEADAANHAKDEFLATVSHELRTPLNAILGWARILSAGRIDAQTSRQAIETIERSAKTQAQLIEDLLDMSRVISGKLRLNLEPVNLSRVAEAALETVRLAAQAKTIQLEAKLDSPRKTVTGDATRLQQVVWNLLSNAIKFTPRGGRIEIRLESNDAEAQITVSDTGQGISPKILPYIFERFRQADSKDTRQHSGLGLGLAIVRHLVELHGGTVTADSAGHGQGAAFIVRLPLATGQTEALKLSEREGDYDRALVETLPELAGLKVLVVDDEESARDVVKLILSRSGAEVTTAASAAEALAVIAQRRPDVMVSDIGMPGENGYELISRLRRLSVEEGGTIPAIALTAYAKTEDRMRALSAGYQTHVSKPVEPAELVLVIASIVAHTKRGR